MSFQQWEYIYMHLGTNDLVRLDKELNKAGAAGFEVVGWASADKTIGLNAWVAILKRPGKKQKMPEGKKGKNEGWYPDPYASHEQRYWSGYYWTHHVSDAGTQSEDFDG
jgi:hypothetical protein